MDNETRVEQRFIELVGKRGFVPFAELEEHLGLSQAELIHLKGKFEDALRHHAGEKLYLTSRVDLNPPGFEIGE
jgi:hypothetical protein